jgi:hydroxymethylpyrimidine pyrophosphatase-like HAD family hydrolase
VKNKPRYLLFSDYDDTYKIIDSPILIYYNNEKIRKFMANQHLFGIVTNRDYKSLYSELEKYNILYDFVSFYSGRVISDNNGNILFKCPIENFVVEEVLRLLAPYQNQIKVELENEFGQFNDTNNTIIINISFYNPLMLFKVKELLKSVEGIEMHSTLFNPFYINILSNKFGKVDSVNFVAKKENIDDENIYVCGNDKYDLAMIKEYNGYSSFLGSPLCMINSLGIISSVGDLAENIEKGIARVRKP